MKTYVIYVLAIMIIAISACTKNNTPVVITSGTKNKIHNNTSTISAGGLMFNDGNVIDGNVITNNSLSYPLYGDFITNTWRNDCRLISDDVQYMTKSDYIRSQWNTISR